jgi:hypothetical protein
LPNVKLGDCFIHTESGIHLIKITEIYGDFIVRSWWDFKHKRWHPQWAAVRNNILEEYQQVTCPKE